MYEWRDDKIHETFSKAGWADVDMLQACILEYHQLYKAICKKIAKLLGITHPNLLLQPRVQPPDLRKLS
jgi:hypothetical protein